MANKIIAFTLEYHQSCLKNCCRICGNRAHTFSEIAEAKKPHFLISTWIKFIFFYGIDIKQDSDLHPKVMCSTCYLGEKEKFQIVSDLWKPHTRLNCKLCVKYDRENKGGRPKKASKKCG